MDSSSIFGIAVGGVIVSAVGGVAEYMREKEVPSYKSFVRDFLIGAILVLFLYQILPESMANLAAYLPSMKTITASIPTASVGDAGPDLQMGPARF